LDPATLQLLAWDGTTWSSSGIAVISHDILNGALTVALSHLSQFAFFAEEKPTNLDLAPEPAGPFPLFLPVVNR